MIDSAIPAPLIGYNAGMKLPHFSLLQLLLSITFAATVLGSLFPILQIAKDSDSTTAWAFASLLIPPSVSGWFFGYAVGRRTLTVRIVAVFIILQVVALGVAAYGLSLEPPLPA